MKRKILVAEDHPDMAELVKSGLESYGYHVELAVNGLEAVQKARSDHPDLIVMDITMPVLDGLQATSQIRQNPETRNIPVLAATALASPEHRERCLTVGCNGYIAKPFTCRQLDATIKAVFNSRPAQA